MKKRMNEGKRLLKLMIIIGLILGSFELQAQSVVIKPVDLQSKIVVGVSGDESGYIKPILLGVMWISVLCFISLIIINFFGP